MRFKVRVGIGGSLSDIVSVSVMMGVRERVRKRDRARDGLGLVI